MELKKCGYEIISKNKKPLTSKIKNLHIFFQNKKEFLLFYRILLLREGKLCQNILE